MTEPQWYFLSGAIKLIIYEPDPDISPSLSFAMLCFFYWVFLLFSNKMISFLQAAFRILGSKLLSLFFFDVGVRLLVWNYSILH